MQERILRLLSLVLFCTPFYLFGVDIAITIDDYPMPKGVIFSAKERTQAFLNACEKHSCQAVFFCVGENCTSKEEKQLLLDVDKKGHFLSNHSMTHSHLSAQSLQVFEEEVTKMDTILSSFKNKRKWYRYPFLDYGNRLSLGGENEKAFGALEILDRLGYSEGYVTMNTFDWHINHRLSEAIKKGLVVDFHSLQKVYVDLVKSWCAYYIDFYETTFCEKITHTLLLHANDLNGLFLAEILQMIKNEGWNLVSPEIAFSSSNWRKKIFDIILKKPSNLDCSEIDKLLSQEHVFVDAHSST